MPSLTPSAVESSPLSSNSRPAAAPRSRLPAQPVELLAAHPPPLCASCAPREGTPLLSPQVKSAPAPSPPWRCEFQQQTQASRCRLCHFAKGGREKEQNKGRGPMNKSRSPEEKESKKKKKAIKASPSLSPTTSAGLLKYSNVRKSPQRAEPCWSTLDPCSTQLAGRWEPLVPRYKPREGRQRWVLTLQAELSSKMGRLDREVLTLSVSLPILSAVAADAESKPPSCRGKKKNSKRRQQTLQILDYVSL